VQRAEPLVELRVWVQQSLLDYMDQESTKLALNKSQYVRMTFARVKRQNEKTQAEEEAKREHSR
jgi:hypothetical protein